MTEDIIVFDIETRLNTDRFQRNLKPCKAQPPKPEDFDPIAVKVGNLKDEAKIEAKIQEAASKHAQQQLDALEAYKQKLSDYYDDSASKAALFPGMSEICAIGWQMHGSEPTTLLLGDEGVATEKDLVEAFLAVMRDVTESPVTAGGNFKFGFWSGNNKRESMFDFLHIREAIRRNRITVNHAIATGPGQRHSPWIDLAMDFFAAGAILPQCDGYPSFLSLDDAATYVGRECPEGFEELLAKDDISVTGAEFGEAMEDPEQREECRRYLVNDLALTRVVADNSFLNFVR